MKKLFTIIFLLSTFSANAQYKSFPDSIAIWGYIEYGDPNQCSNGICEIDMVYQIGIDTVLFAKSYHQLYNQSGYLGGIREDSALLKIYFLPADSLTEFLLYDFSLNVGDTVVGMSNCSPLLITVTGIDSTNAYSPDYRKIIHVTPPALDYVEGIGSIGGVLAPQCNGLDFHWALTCFSNNGNLIFTTGNPFLNCLSPLATTEYDRVNAFSIVPGVLNSGQTLVINYQYFSPVEKIEIIDSWGKVVNRNFQNLFVNTNSFKAGIYFVSITAKDQSHFNKAFIIQ